MRLRDAAAIFLGFCDLTRTRRALFNLPGLFLEHNNVQTTPKYPRRYF